MIAAANRDGYAGATVTAVIAEAGVSRPTFYEHFKDRDDCFMQTLEQSQAQLLDEIQAAIEQAAPEDALTAAISAQIEHARSQPTATRFLTNEPLAATRLALDTRDQHQQQIAQLIERAQKRLPKDTATVALPMKIVIGAISRILGNRLRRGDPGLTSIHAELLDWTSRYQQPRSQQRRQTLKPGPKPKNSAVLLEKLIGEAPPIPRGRSRMTREEIAVNHRERILHAIAKLSEEKGYDATTTADITREAQLDAKVFYRLFADKQEAFMSYHELGFQQLMAVMADAFFKGETWPERSWQSGGAFLGFLAREPLVAHIGFIESYAVGAAAIQRVEDSHVAFTMFLHEGYQWVGQADAQAGAAEVAPPSKLVLEAIIAGVFELVYLQVRAGKTNQLPRYLGLMGALVLTPFLGVEAANAFIEGAGG